MRFARSYWNVLRRWERRVLVTCVAVISLVLTVFAWSFWDNVALYRMGAKRDFLCSTRFGRVTVQSMQLQMQTSAGVHWSFRRLRQGKQYLWPTQLRFWMPNAYRGIASGISFPIPYLAIPPLFVCGIIAVRARRRIPPSDGIPRCSKCSYPLGATQQRCPECGLATQSAQHARVES